jgi:RNA exonuclease 4
MKSKNTTVYRHRSNVMNTSAIQSSSSACSAGTTSSSSTASSSPGPSSSSASPSSLCSRKQHDAPLTNRDLYFSLRCGMVGIGHAQGPTTGAVLEQHSAVGRVTVVNWENDIVLDTLVCISVPVTDYRTHSTEITPAHDLSINSEAALSLEVVRSQVAALLKGKILIGHGLEVDLAALGLSHPWCDVRDTATYPPYMEEIVADPLMTAMMLPRDLEDLLSHFLGRQLSWRSTTQQQQQPSKLAMEAIGCLDLYKIRRHEWEEELILLSRQKQRQRQAVLDMRNSATTSTRQLMSITEYNIHAELSSTDGIAVTAARGLLGRSRRVQKQYQKEVNIGQGSPPPPPPPSRYCCAEEPAVVWDSYEDSSSEVSTNGASTLTSIYSRHIGAGAVSLISTRNNEDDVSADSASAGTSYCFCHRDHHIESRETALEPTHPPRFVYEPQDGPPTRATDCPNINTWKTCNVGGVDLINNFDESWLLKSEHGSGAGPNSGRSIWSPLVPPPPVASSSSVSSLSPVPPSNMTSASSLKGNAPPDWSIGSSSHSNLARSRAAPPSSVPWQQPLAANNTTVNATPATSFTEEQVMEHLVASLLTFGCDHDDDRIDSTPTSSVTSRDSSLSLQTMMQPGDLSPSYSPRQDFRKQPSRNTEPQLVNC